MSTVGISLIALALIAASVALAEQDQQPLGHTKPSGHGSPFTDEFSALAKSVMDEWHVPGMSLAVVDNQSVFAEGFGFATLPDTPATPETLYYVGSTTKAQTAAVLAHFIDTKTFDGLSRGWSTTISSLIPDDFVLQDEWATQYMNLEDAVSHRSGMASHDNAWHREINGTQGTIRDIVRNLRNVPYGIEPRVKWWYCNSLYTTLSHILETLTGKWLGDVFKEVIWGPLGMDRTYMDLEQAKKSEAVLATAYDWRPKDKKYDELEYLGISEVNGAGGVISNVLDYAKWLQCLIHETEPFSKAVHKDIQTPRFLQSDQPVDENDVVLYGLAWFRTTIHGQVAYWHTGSVMTFGAYVYWFPELKYGIVAFSNGGFASKPAEHVLVRRLIEDRIGIPPEERVDVNKREKEIEEARQQRISRADEILYPHKPQDPIPPTLNPEQLVGRYFHKGYGTVTLFEEPLNTDSDKSVLVANRTELTWQQQWRLHHVSGDYWTMYAKVLLGMNDIFDFLPAEFKFGTDGKVAGLEVTFLDGELTEGVILFQKVEN